MKTTTPLILFLLVIAFLSLPVIHFLGSNFGQYILRYWTHYTLVQIPKDSYEADGQWRELKLEFKVGNKRIVERQGEVSAPIAHT